MTTNISKETSDSTARHQHELMAKSQQPAAQPQGCDDWQTVERLELAKEIRQLEQERDQLRAQVADLQAAFKRAENELCDRRTVDAVRTIRAAIARAEKGGQP